MVQSHLNNVYDNIHIVDSYGNLFFRLTNNRQEILLYYFSYDFSIISNNPCK